MFVLLLNTNEKLYCDEFIILLKFNRISLKANIFTKQ